MAIVTLGIDLGKNVCSVAGLDAFGHVVMSRRIRRFRLLSVLAGLAPVRRQDEWAGRGNYIKEALAHSD